MRTVKVPVADVLEWLKNPQGVAAVFPVLVDWPELRLTEEQSTANAIAVANGKDRPFDDNSIFLVEIGWGKP